MTKFSAVKKKKLSSGYEFQGKKMNVIAESYQRIVKFVKVWNVLIWSGIGKKITCLEYNYCVDMFQWFGKFKNSFPQKGGQV